MSVALKLSPKTQKDIVQVYTDGFQGTSLTVSEIAQMFGTSASTVSVLAKRAGYCRKLYANIVDSTSGPRSSYANRKRLDRVTKHGKPRNV